MGSKDFTLRKSERSHQANALNTLAWNNVIRPCLYLVGFRDEVMIGRNSWGHLYSTVRGEILGFVEDGLLRKHLPKMFSLIKNES